MHKPEQPQTAIPNKRHGRWCGPHRPLIGPSLAPHRSLIGHVKSIPFPEYLQGFSRSIFGGSISSTNWLGSTFRNTYRCTFRSSYKQGRKLCRAAQEPEPGEMDGAGARRDTLSEGKLTSRESRVLTLHPQCLASPWISETFTYPERPHDFHVPSMALPMLV